MRVDGSEQQTLCGHEHADVVRAGDAAWRNPPSTILMLCLCAINERGDDE